MNKTTLKNITESCRKQFATLSIGSGLEQLKTIVRYCSDSQIISQVEEIEENYHSMLSFLARGGKDEERNLTQKQISQKAQKILRVAHRNIRLQDVQDKYSKSYHELQKLYGNEQEEALLKKWNTNLLPDEQMLIQDQLFYLIWTSPLWTQKQTAHWYEFISRQADYVRIHFIGAVLLSLWEYFDKEKLAFLFLFTDTENEKLNALTITALILLAEKYEAELASCPELLNHYRESNVNKYIATVFKEKLLILQTVIAVRKEDEFMSGISRAKTKEEIEAIMNKKIEHLRFMIEKGLDVNLGNRTELWYRCDFLRENISHWCFPFDKSSPVLDDLLFDKKGNFNKQTYHLLDLPNECDIDRYAIFTYLASNQHKNELLEQLARGMNLAELNAGGEIIPYFNYFKTTMQNLYRIFVHSPIRNEIDNPFSRPHIFWQNSILKDYFSEEKVIELCSEMLDANIYDQPVAWLDQLAKTAGTSLDMLRIKSECLYILEEYYQAIASLTQILFLDEENEWALNMIQKCYRDIAMKDKQLEYIQKLLALKPDNVSYLTTASIVLIDMGKYDQALEHLFHLELIDPGNPRYMGSIEICAIHLKRFDLALRYNHKILEDTDFEEKYLEHLNGGHIHFIMGDWKEALNCYRQFKTGVERINKTENMELDPNKEFLSSAKILQVMGISLSDIMLMRDMIPL
jgi:tetratricopeptide (TPR) repeat protein